MNTWKKHSEKKILPPDQLEQAVFTLRQEKKTIATLNGSFDLLHAGHMHILYEAAKCGDILIVALNSDQSIKNYKGPSRPFISLSYRMQMMAAIEFVDYVTWFDELDPRNILGKIKPDVHVNGLEYGENCIEGEIVKKNGGRLFLVDRIDNLATSEIVAKIQASLSCV